LVRDDELQALHAAGGDEMEPGVGGAVVEPDGLEVAIRGRGGGELPVAGEEGGAGAFEGLRGGDVMEIVAAGGERGAVGLDIQFGEELGLEDAVRIEREEAGPEIGEAGGGDGEELVLGGGEVFEGVGLQARDGDLLGGEFGAESELRGRALAADADGETEEVAGFGAERGVRGLGVEVDGVEAGVAGFAGLGAKDGEETGAVFECGGAGTNPVFAGEEAGEAVDAAIVREGAGEDIERETGGVSEDGDAGEADGVFVIDGAGDDAETAGAEFGEEVRIFGDGEREGLAVGAALGVADGEVAGALGGEPVLAGGDADELELPGAAGAGLEGAQGGGRAGEGLEADEAARERVTGLVVE
jgi:hypothetical protein